MNWNKFQICIIALLFQIPAFAQEEGKISILFAGDVMQHGGQISAAYNKQNDGYDYTDCFKFVKPIVSQADVSIVNLEVTHAGKPYKGYPQFTAPPELSEAIVEAGFNVVLTANNHSCDGGSKGILGTLDVLDKLKVKHTGTFRSQKERDANYPLLIEKNGFRIAVMNYTYGTNGLTVAPPLIVNYIDTAMILKDFAKARKMDVDYIVCTMHWGDEYQSLPNNYQKSWEAFCYKEGADMVIGGHPHVLQPIERKIVKTKERLTVWSLGNYVSNQRDRLKDGGIMVRTFLEKQEGKTVLKEVDYVFTWVHPRQEGITKPFYILPDFDYNQHNPQFLTAENLTAMKTYLSDSRKLFTAHNKGILREAKADSIPGLPELYRFYLKGYYSVLAEEHNTSNFTTKLTPETKPYFHQFTTSEGKYALLSGMHDNLEGAQGDANFIRDIGFQNVKVVFVDPKTLKIIPQ